MFKRITSLFSPVQRLLKEQDRLLQECKEARLEVEALKSELAKTRLELENPVPTQLAGACIRSPNTQIGSLDNEEPGYFIITSHGRTASYWLASALHQHPDIICGHSRQHPPVPDYNRTMDWSNVQQILAQTGEDHWNGLVRAEKTYTDDYFDELVTCGAARFYGCVHTFTLYGLMQDFAKVPPRRKFKIVNLTRHPVNRITSWKNRVLEEWRHSPRARGFWLEIYQTSDPHRSMAEYAKSELAMDPNEERTIAAICAVIDVAAEASEISQPVTTIPMERLIADQQYFCWLLRLVTQPCIEITQDYVDRVFARGKLNPSNSTAQLPFIEYSKWQEWERALFREACTRWPIAQQFGPLGYDLAGITP